MYYFKWLSFIKYQKLICYTYCLYYLVFIQHIVFYKYIYTLDQIFFFNIWMKIKCAFRIDLQTWRMFEEKYYNTPNLKSIASFHRELSYNPVSQSYRPINISYVRICIKHMWGLRSLFRVATVANDIHLLL